LSQQYVNVRREVFDGMKKHLDDTLLLWKEEFTSKADILNARVYFSNAERELLKSVRITKLIEKTLQNTLSINESRIVTLSNLFYFDEIEDISYFKNLAIQTFLN